MPKLYYTPTSCGAASFIAAAAAGVHIPAEQADIRSHKTSSGEDFYKINPKGNVPALVLDDGTVLNEGAAVLQWIADQVFATGVSTIRSTAVCLENCSKICTGSRNGCC
jgi:glutathione S-transferase